ncbi:hypothetical protein MT418_004981 [Batrachochytrium dendrobatidis]
MCGRTVLVLDEDDIQTQTGVDTWHNNQQYRPSYNVCPTRMQPVIHRHTDSHKPVLDCMKWGIKTQPKNNSESSHLVINCRDDTLMSSYRPMFKQVRDSNRCIVIAQGYYEWQRKTTSQPYFISLGTDSTPDTDEQIGIKANQSSTKLMYMAAVWMPSKSSTETPTYALVTTPAAPSLEWLHDRMPVMLQTEADRALWMDPSIKFTSDVAALMRPMHSGLVWFPVSTMVGKIETDTPECIKAITVATPKKMESFWTCPPCTDTDKIHSRSLVSDLAASDTTYSTNRNICKNSPAKKQKLVHASSSKSKAKKDPMTTKRITDFFGKPTASLQDK